MSNELYYFDATALVTAEAKVSAVASGTAASVTLAGSAGDFWGDWPTSYNSNAAGWYWITYTSNGVPMGSILVYWNGTVITIPDPPGLADVAADAADAAADSAAAAGAAGDAVQLIRIGSGSFAVTGGTPFAGFTTTSWTIPGMALGTSNDGAILGCVLRMKDVSTGNGTYAIRKITSFSNNVGAATITVGFVQPVTATTGGSVTFDWDLYAAGDSWGTDNSTAGQRTLTGFAFEAQADVIKLNGSTTALSNLKASVEVVATGTVGGGTSTTTDVYGTTLFAGQDVDHWKGRVIIFQTGALAKQAAVITASDSTAGFVTVSGLTQAPSDGDTFVIV